MVNNNTGLNKYDWIAAGITAGIGLISAAGTLLTIIFSTKGNNMRANIPPPKNN